MKKTVRDISGKGDNKAVNLAGPQKKTKESPLQKSQSFNKKKSNVRAVNDIKGAKPLKFAYIKGKNFKPPPFLGNLIRVGISGILIILLINIVNIYYKGQALQDQITQSAKEGYSLLFDGGKNASKIEFQQATAAFDQALDSFNQAEREIGFISTGATFYSRDSEITVAANALLGGGKDFAQAGTYFIEAIEQFNKIPVYFFAKNSNEESIEDPGSLSDALQNGLEKTKEAIVHISAASEKIQKINEDLLPSDMKARVILAKEKIAEVADSLSAISEHFPALLKLMGDRYPHRYLILLQNNNEIRPSGGFIGSYAIIDVNDGLIQNIEVFDSYDIDGSYGAVIEPPDEFKSFTSNWRFRDSNYSHDFPTSAAKARWFLQKEGGPSVDTVIAINQGLLKDLLEISGPVQVGEFGKLDSGNYELLLSYVIESKAFGPEDPKHILKVFIPAFKEAIFKQQNISKVSTKLYKAVQQKHIMLYSSDEEVQAFFDAMDLSGRVYQEQEGEDYFSLVHISIGGTKSEKFIEEKISHQTHIDADGSLLNTVTISRKHTWDDALYNQWVAVLKSYGLEDISQQAIDILGRGKNEVSSRIYVPDGSILIDSSNEDILTKYDKDLNKTYFFTKFLVEAGETDTLTISYKLPFTLELENPNTYRLIVEKQPGSRGSLFNKTVSSDEEVLNLAAFPEETRLEIDGSLTYATNLVYDRYFSGIWKLED